MTKEEISMEAGRLGVVTAECKQAKTEIIDQHCRVSEHCKKVVVTNLVTSEFYREDLKKKVKDFMQNCVHFIIAITNGKNQGRLQRYCMDISQKQGGAHGVSICGSSKKDKTKICTSLEGNIASCC